MKDLNLTHQYPETGQTTTGMAIAFLSSRHKYLVYNTRQPRTIFIPSSAWFPRCYISSLIVSLSRSKGHVRVNMTHGETCCRDYLGKVYIRVMVRKKQPCKGPMWECQRLTLTDWIHISKTSMKPNTLSFSTFIYLFIYFLVVNIILRVLWIYLTFHGEKVFAWGLAKMRRRWTRTLERHSTQSNG